MAAIGFLEKIQLADDSAKRLWIAAGTVLLMTAIVALWLLFSRRLLRRGKAPKLVSFLLAVRFVG